MSVNKRLYRDLFQQCVKGMSLNKGLAFSRFQFDLSALNCDQWNSIKYSHCVSNEEIDDFFQCCRGNYHEVEENWVYSLELCKLLVGESFVLGYGEDSFLRLLKIDELNYMIRGGNTPLKIGTLFSLDPYLRLHRQEETDLPGIGNVKLQFIKFVLPSPFHYSLDLALLRNHKQTPVDNSIMELYVLLKEIIPRHIDLEMLREVINLTQSKGISTFGVREIIDALTFDFKDGF